VRVLGAGQVKVVFFQLFAHQLSLRPVSVLDQRLKHSAAVVLEAQLLVLFTNRLNALVNELVLLGIRNFFFLHQELIVVDLKEPDKS